MKNAKVSATFVMVCLLATPLMAQFRILRPTRQPNRTRNTQQNQKRQRQQEQAMAKKWQQKTFDQLEKSLDLDASQQAKVRPMLASMAKQIEQLDGEKGLNGQEKKARLQELYNTTWTRISGLLTPEQRDTIQQNQVVDNLDDELKLSRDQEEKIRKILRAQVDDDYQLRDDKTLSENDKSLKAQEIDTDTWAQVEDVLTAAQRTKLTELRADDALAALSDAVRLTRDQKTQIKPVLVELMTRLIAMRADKKLSLAEKGAQIENTSTAMWAGVRGMLSPEQQGKYDAARAQQQTAQQEALQPPKKPAKTQKKG